VQGGAAGYLQFDNALCSSPVVLVLTPVADTAAEDAETVLLVFSQQAGHNITVDSAPQDRFEYAVLDNDLTFAVAASPSAFAEGNPGADVHTPVTFTVTRQGGATAGPVPLTVTKTGAAAAGTDFVAVTSSTGETLSLDGSAETLTFPMPSASQAVTLDWAVDWTVEPSPETLVLTLGGTAPADFELHFLGAGAATVTVTDDDVLLSVATMAPAQYLELAANRLEFNLTWVGRNPLPGEQVAVDIDGSSTAVSGADYVWTGVEGAGGCLASVPLEPVQGGAAGYLQFDNALCSSPVVLVLTPVHT
jgi:hypothetical protein